MPCKITKRVEHRPITEDEFKRQKNSPEFAQLRFLGKKLNFLMIFGGGAKMFAQQALETEWSLSQIEDFLSKNDCTEEQEEIDRMYKYATEDEKKYYVAAQKMKNNFFKAYPGLADRIVREQKFAEQNGYCRTIFGASRNLIELQLQGSWDQRNISGIISNLDKVTSNFMAQNCESCTRGTAMRQMADWLINNNYKSYVWSEIHDSIDLCIYKPELEPVLAHIKHLCERRVPEYTDKWVPLPVDCEISDIKKGEYYKGGASPESYNIDWDNWHFHDIDPFDVELTPEYERDYFKQRKEYWLKLGKIDPQARQIQSYLNKKGIKLD